MGFDRVDFSRFWAPEDEQRLRWLMSLNGFHDAAGASVMDVMRGAPPERVFIAWRGWKGGAA